MNPDVRVSVKVPVVPNIGTIGLGIAKAGADIITLSGFEGGTGAARQHALRHVGLPSDIGTRPVHLALMEAGIRNRVEIWADGGYRHAHDIVKLHCLGANRVGVRHPGDGLARLHDLPRLPARHLPRRHRDPDRDDGGRPRSTASRSSRRRRSTLPPRTAPASSPSMGEEVRELVAELGYERAQDLVGRYDLLEQASHAEALDLAELITPLEEFLDLEPIDMPVAEEELVAAEARAEAGLVRARPIRMER